jgi:hypothetical protein
MASQGFVEDGAILFVKRRKDHKLNGIEDFREEKKSVTEEHKYHMSTSKGTQQDYLQEVEATSQISRTRHSKVVIVRGRSRDHWSIQMAGQIVS